MSENKKNVPLSSEIKEEELDKVAGGINRDRWDNYTSCKPCPGGCGNTVPWDWQGPCLNCLNNPSGPQSQDDI